MSPACWISKSPSLSRQTSAALPVEREEEHAQFSPTGGSGAERAEGELPQRGKRSSPGGLRRRGQGTLRRRLPAGRLSGSGRRLSTVAAKRFPPPAVCPARMRPTSLFLAFWRKILDKSTCFRYKVVGLYTVEAHVRNAAGMYLYRWTPSAVSADERRDRPCWKHVPGYRHKGD